PSYDTWLSETKASDVTDNVFTVLVPNEFIRNWLEKKYTKIIMQLLFEITGMELDVVFVIEEDNGVKKEVIDSSKEAEKVKQQKRLIYLKMYLFSVLKMILIKTG